MKIYNVKKMVEHHKNMVASSDVAGTSFHDRVVAEYDMFLARVKELAELGINGNYDIPENEKELNARFYTNGASDPAIDADAEQDVETVFWFAHKIASLDCMRGYIAEKKCYPQIVEKYNRKKKILAG
ncbi:MAG: hypothetical protein V2I97_17630 [Desulfococcaceae bacterium]|jgi:hypothetical protein|nr:hypothetical protein [Desulfococcaceae bacterium]